MILAIEGVSCTGKSTLAARLSERLGWAVIGCYQHVVADPSVLGRPLAADEDEQLQALDAHLNVEARRARLAQAAMARDGAVILDRSVDTLLAHMGAVGQLQGLAIPAIQARARALVDAHARAGAALIPDLTLLLVGEHDVLARRGATRPEVPPLYYAPTFAAPFNEHFTDPLARSCLILNANAEEPQVLESALAALEHATADHVHAHLEEPG